jgi:hypothetical protein
VKSNQIMLPELVIIGHHIRLHIPDALYLDHCIFLFHFLLACLFTTFHHMVYERQLLLIR